MAYTTNEQESSASGLGSALRVIPKTIRPVTFKQGTGILPVLTPVAFNTSDEMWVPWTLGINQITSLTMDEGVIAGDFTLTVSSQTTSAIAFDATAEDIQTALEALSSVDPGDVEVTGGPIHEAPVLIEFKGQYRSTSVSITVDDTGIDPAEITAAEEQAAVPPDDSVDVIKGFVWPNSTTLSASGEVIGDVLIEGKVHFSDIPVPDGISTTELQTACQTGPRGLGIIMDGLESVR